MKKSLSAVLVVVVLVLVTSTNGIAQSSKSGGVDKMEELVRQCEQKSSLNQDPKERLLENIFGVGQCFGFFQGLLDANSLTESILGKPIFCLPTGGISAGQAIKIYLKFANDHPEHLHQSARTTAAAAFLTAFPCQK